MASCEVLAPNVKSSLGLLYESTFDFAKSSWMFLWGVLTEITQLVLQMLFLLFSKFAWITFQNLLVVAVFMFCLRWLEESKNKHENAAKLMQATLERAFGDLTQLWNGACSMFTNWGNFKGLAKEVWSFFTSAWPIGAFRQLFQDLPTGPDDETPPGVDGKNLFEDLVGKPPPESGSEEIDLGR